jgi:hypothetical protein
MRTIMKMIMMILAILAGSQFASAGQHGEDWYRDQWCAGRGKTEAAMSDGTRCDCLTATHAVEVEHARKWAESVGQALNYAMQSNKRAGIVMIVERPKDRKYWIRLNSIIQSYDLPIDTWKIEN